MIRELPVHNTSQLTEEMNASIIKAKRPIFTTIFGKKIMNTRNEDWTQLSFSSGSVPGREDSSIYSYVDFSFVATYWLYEINCDYVCGFKEGVKHTPPNIGQSSSYLV